MGKNIQTSLATRLAELSKQFRTMQSSYMQTLKKRQDNARTNMFDFGEERADSVVDRDFMQSQFQYVQDNEQKIREREGEINEIAKSIFTLAEIFKDLQTMVIAQGTVLDRIDYNIDLTVTQLKTAAVELEKGTEYQKQANKKMIILLLILVVFGMLVAVIFKPR